jgi:hypothetical protein
MHKRIVALAFVALVALLPGTALAAGESDKDQDGFVFRANGDYHLAQGDGVNNVIVASGNAFIDGTVHTNLIVLNGDAVVNGVVDGELTVVRGTLTLGGTANVNKVTLVRSDLVRDNAATVRGDINRTTNVAAQGWWIFFGIAVLVGLSLAVLASGLVFATVGGRQLTTLAESMGTHPGQTILAGFITAIGLPIVGIVLLITVVGIPLGLGVLFMLLPALAFLGYIVAGAWLGLLILNRGKTAPAHPYGEVLLGLFLLQIAFAIPGLGFVAFPLLSLWGTGAIAYRAWTGLRGTAPTPATPPAPVAPTTTPSPAA